MSTNNERFVRWQGSTMAQMAVVLGVLGGLSLGGLGLCLSLLARKTFAPQGLGALWFLLACTALIVASASSLVANITRLIDFRLTAKKVRAGEVEEPLTFFGTDASGYGRATWRFLWLGVCSLGIGVACLVIAVCSVYLGRFLAAAGF